MPCCFPEFDLSVIWCCGWTALLLFYGVSLVVCVSLVCLG